MPADQAQQYDLIGVRGVIGFFYEALEQFDGQSWISNVCNTFESNQDTETYAGLGMVPQLREWIGGKEPKSFTEMSVKITNKDFESTLRIKNKDRRRDKTGQIQARIGELAERAIAHDAVLLSNIIVNGTTTTVASSYDGLALFSASHKIGTQALNNIVPVTLSTLPLGTAIGAGTATAPSVGAMAYCIMNAIQAMYGFLDDQGQPLNELAKSFVVMVPISLSAVALAAVQSAYLGIGATNPIQFLQGPAMAGLSIKVVPNPRLSAWTNQFAVFRADGAFKPLIKQVEVLNPQTSVETSGGTQTATSSGMGLIMKALAEGSDNEFLNNEALFSVEKAGNVGIGRFDQAALVQMS